MLNFGEETILSTIKSARPASQIASTHMRVSDGNSRSFGNFGSSVMHFRSDFGLIENRCAASLLERAS
jgi:hypothetical protein